ncbi:MAG: hypothetical protein ACJAWQ_001918 [Paraglaciecola sp.]|jgi:hypothetical protein
MSSNKVIIQFKGMAADQEIDFKVSDSIIKKNTKISNDDITISGGKGSLNITIDASRNGNSDVADWYDTFVQSNTHHMLHTARGSNNPSTLNFAVQGILIIGNKNFAVCIGQGHYGVTNNWHLCGLDLSARANNKSGYLNDAYYITTSDSNAFNISDAQGIIQGKGFDLWAYTSSPILTPRFDLEGDALHSFPYSATDRSSVGTMKQGYAFDTTGTLPTHRDFHLQLLTSEEQQLEDIKYKINRITGAIEGNGVLEQTAIESGLNSTPYMMNYGVSHAALPLGNQSYIYAGEINKQWMQDTANILPDLTVQDLVLSGSHDAGMYQINIADASTAIDKLKTEQPILGKLIDLAESVAGVQVLANLSLTQKDTAYNQLVAGIRYFDFRPAYARGKFDTANVYHLHNFIPGVLFTEFLANVNQFLQENKGEFAIIRIASSGIDTNSFTPLSQSEVESCLERQMSDKVGYQTVSNLEDFYARTLSDMGKGKRLIVIFQPGNVNDSYSDSAYSNSMTDPSSIIAALDGTIKDTSPTQYTVLQLQDTASAALMNHIPDILSHATAWINDLVFSATGNLLQATKPIFDHATYTWLTQASSIKGIAAQHGPVIVQNDFVDIALYEHALALTKQRYQIRSKAKANELVETE